MSETRVITTLDKLNLLTDFLERKGLWEGAYELDKSNFDMWCYVSEFHMHPCGTVGCIAGHMGNDKIWRNMGFYCVSDPEYKQYRKFAAIEKLFGLAYNEIINIFYTIDNNSVKSAVARINKIKDNYRDK